MGGQGDMPPPYFLKWRGRLVFCPLTFLGVDIFKTLITLHMLLLRKNVSMISVCQTSHCLCQYLSVFFEDLILTVTEFSDLHSALRKSTHAIVTWWGGGSLLPTQESHPALSLPVPPPLLLMRIYAHDKDHKIEKEFNCCVIH